MNYVHCLENINIQRKPSLALTFHLETDTTSYYCCVYQVLRSFKLPPHHTVFALISSSFSSSSFISDFLCFFSHGFIISSLHISLSPSLCHSITLPARSLCSPTVQLLPKASWSLRSWHSFVIFPCVIFFSHGPIDGQIRHHTPKVGP